MISRARASDDQLPEVLGRDGGVLGFRSIDRGGRAGAVFLQPRVQPGLSGAADPVGGPVSGQQQQGGFGAAVVKGPLEGGEVFEQLGLQSVDRPDPVRGFIAPPGGEDPQPGAALVLGPQGLQVTAHPGLVSN